MLVGGGELHDRFSSLVRTSAPLRRGIQRFTGITQAMVDGAPSLEAVLPRDRRGSSAGRVMVAHNAPFDRRVLRQAFARIGLRVARPAGDLHRRAGADDAAAAARAAPGGAGRCARDRGRRRSPGAARCGDVRAGAVRAVPASVRERDHDRARRSCCSSPRRPRTARQPTSPHDRPRACRRAFPRLDFADLPRDPGVYLFRDARRPHAVRRQVDLDPQPRAGAFRALARPGGLDRARDDRRLPRDPLGARRAGAREPADQAAPSRRATSASPGRDDRLVYIRCRLDISFPILEVAPQPGRRPRGHDRAAAGPATRAGAGRAARLAVRPAPLRAAAAAPRASVGLRADGPLPVAVPRRPRPEPLSPPAGRGAAAVRRRRGRRPATARARRGPDAARPRRAQRYERALAAPAGAAAAARSWGVSTGCSRRPTRVRGCCSRAHPARPGSFDAFWLVGGRLVDWGPLPTTRRARASAPRPRSCAAARAGRARRTRATG